MFRFLLAVAALAFVGVVYRVVALRCGRKPALRLRFIIGGVSTLGLGALLVPWLFAKLKPPWSESPAGLLIILGKFLVVGGLGLVAIGILLGVAFPVRARDSAQPRGPTV